MLFFHLDTADFKELPRMKVTGHVGILNADEVQALACVFIRKRLSNVKCFCVLIVAFRHSLLLIKCNVKLSERLY